MFMQLKIPHLLFLESKKTLLPVVGKDYFYVPKDLGVLCPFTSEPIEIPNKDHNSVVKISSRDDRMYKTIKEFIL